MPIRTELIELIELQLQGNLTQRMRRKRGFFPSSRSKSRKEKASKQDMTASLFGAKNKNKRPKINNDDGAKTNQCECVRGEKEGTAEGTTEGTKKGTEEDRHMVLQLATTKKKQKQKQKQSKSKAKAKQKQSKSKAKAKQKQSKGKSKQKQ